MQNLFVNFYSFVILTEIFACCFSFGMENKCLNVMPKNILSSVTKILLFLCCVVKSTHKLYTREDIDQSSAIISY